MAGEYAITSTPTSAVAFTSAPVALATFLVPSPAAAADVRVQPYLLAGAPGPVGPRGPAVVVETHPFVGVGAGQSVTLRAAAGSFQLLVVNGLVQSPNSYVVGEASLVIPAGLVWDGADCLFFYQT